MKPETEVWVDVAEIDYRSAVRLMEGSDPISASALFHAHQSVEKYLKSLLEEAGRPVPRTHDLGVVLRLVSDLVPDLDPYTADIQGLVPYAVELRYWGASTVLDDVAEHTASAMSTMETARSIVRRALGLPMEDDSGGVSSRPGTDE